MRNIIVPHIFIQNIRVTKLTASGKIQLRHNQYIRNYNGHFMEGMIIYRE